MVVATAGGDRMIRFWAVATGKELRALETGSPFISRLALSPDGKLVASDLNLWEAASGKLLGRFRDQDYSIQAMAFAPDSRTLAMATTDVQASKRRMIRLWDVAEVKEIRHFGEQPVHALGYSQDGKLLAAGNGDGTISLWDVASGNEARRIKGHNREVNSIAFSPDGKLVASGSFDGDLFLWDAATGRQVRRLVANVRGHPWPANVLALAFSPDGRMLASGNSSPSTGLCTAITLWEVSTGGVRCELTGHQGDVNSLAFAQDSQRLVSGSTDTTALIWDVTAPLRPARKAGLSRAQLDALWADLLAPDAARGYGAICTLAGSAESVTFLRQRLPLDPPDDRRIAQLIQDLDSDVFKRREEASQSLERLQEAPEPALRKALEGGPSPEVRTRVNQLLEKLSAEWLRTQRLIEVLERMGTPEAVQVLQAVARGTPAARRTQEAQAALDRLARRAPITP
jgi:dipeptidyl aminopeptidase/acylaminoacyl peptidase